MAKKKRTAKQIAATKKMLAANAARKAGKKPAIGRGTTGGKERTKSPRKAGRTAHVTAPAVVDLPPAKKARKPAKRKGAKKPAAQKKTPKKTGGKKPRKGTKASRSAAGKKAARTRKRNEKRKAEGKAPAPAKKAKKNKKSGSRAKRKTPRSRAYATRTEVVKLPAHTTKIYVTPQRSAPRKKSPKKKAKKGAKTKGKGRGKGRGKKGKGKAAYPTKGFGHTAKENPLGAWELLFGGAVALVGFAASEIADRALATHSLTANGDGTYTDNAPTTGDYANLWNGTAIAAPMDLPRWGVGAALVVVPLGLSAVVGSPTGKTALQMFAVGSGLRLLGKGLTDLTAMLTSSTEFGQAMFPNELKAQANMPNATLQSNQVPTQGTGTAALPQGVGACCPSCAQKAAQAATPPPAQTQPAAPPPRTQPAPPPVQTQPAQLPPPPPPAPPPMTAPDGQPILTRQPAPPPAQTTTPPAPPPQNWATHGRDSGRATNTSSRTAAVYGLPDGVGKPRSIFQWGHDHDRVTNE